LKISSSGVGGVISIVGIMVDKGFIVLSDPGDGRVVDFFNGLN
jgi:hypothetical protein